VIVEEAPEKEIKRNEVDRPLHLLTLSARNKAALNELVKRYQNYLSTHLQEDLADIAYTANTGRNHFAQRIALIAKDSKEALQKLQQEDYQRKKIKAGKKNKVVFSSSAQTSSEEILLQSPSLPGTLQDWKTFLENVAKWYVEGADIAWEEFDAQYYRQKLELPTYPFQRQRYWASVLDETRGRIAIEDLKQWFYRTMWQEQSLPTAKEVPSRANETWLLFVSQHNVAERLGQRLRNQGARCVYVEAGEAFKVIDQDHRVIRSLELEDAKKLVETVGKITGIIYLWGYENIKVNELTSRQLWSIQRVTCGGLLHLLQALVAASQKPKLHVITCSAQAVGKETVAIEQGPLLGLGSVIALENPELQTRLIDLDAAMSAEVAAETLLREISSLNKEDRIAWRAETRYVPRVEKYDLTTLPDQEVKIQAEGSYLITGGLGGLGLQVARWLVDQGAKNLILIGRRAPQTEAQEQIQALEKAGAKITIEQVDVAHEEAVIALLKMIKEKLPPLRGIVHAAGIDDRGLLVEQTWKRFEEVMAAKVLGGWHLHRHAQDQPVEQFILFSSIASFLGSARQGPYTAANRFLDSLTWYRQQQGKPVTDINWGPWAEVGLVVKAGIETKSRRGFFSSRQGIRALAYALQKGVVEAACILPDYLEFMLDFLPEPRPLWLSTLKIPTKPKPAVVSEWTKEWERAEPSKRKKLLRDLIQTQLREILRLPESAVIDNQLGFFEMGMDSLMAMELKERLQQSLGTRYKLTATAAFDYPAVNSLVKHIESLLNQFAKLEEKPTEKEALETAKDKALKEKIKTLSLEEINKLIGK
jgi:acyl transferase domain-containing protein